MLHRDTSFLLVASDLTALDSLARRKIHEDFTCTYRSGDIALLFSHKQLMLNVAVSRRCRITPDDCLLRYDYCLLHSGDCLLRSDDYLRLTTAYYPTSAYYAPTTAYYGGSGHYGSGYYGGYNRGGLSGALAWAAGPVFVESTEGGIVAGGKWRGCRGSRLYSYVFVHGRPFRHASYQVSTIRLAGCSYDRPS